MKLPSRDESLVFGTVVNLWTLVAVVSVFITIVLVDRKYWKFGPLALLLVFGLAIVNAARRVIRARDKALSDAEYSSERERTKLQAELVEARRDKFAESLRPAVEKFLAGLDTEERTAVRFLCIKESWEDTQLDRAIPIGKVRSARNKGMEAGIIETDDDRWSASGRLKTYWRIVPGYLPPLKKIVMEIENCDGNGIKA